MYLLTLLTVSGKVCDQMRAGRGRIQAGYAVGGGPWSDTRSPGRGVLVEEARKDV